MPDLQPFEKQSAEHLRLALESGHIGVWELDVSTGLAVKNEAHDKIFGFYNQSPEWSYDRFLEHVAEGERSRVDALQKAAIAGRQAWSFECQIRTAAGENRWIKASGRPIFAADGTMTSLIGQVVDITESKQNEARLRLITEELNHRVRNMLAMITSMIRLTARGAEDVTGFAQALEGRVGALSRTQNLLVGDAAGATMPSAILEMELAALVGTRRQVEVLVEEEARLGASAGQGLALVFHELLTNAIKYGALSTNQGTVAIRFGCRDGQVEIDWQERGGPPLAQPRGSGFGSMLISGALAPDGTVEQVFAPEGLQCCIRLRAAA
ncbi:HWE histidine kinase domain-containing protein [Croceicoccus sp. BE223]|uniref:sensor histidine kinase n=1 Tax=Croceicoccus sp. BE223 TaxID=2817716 RepID=UPI00285DA727|nr:HWE histidine kinase domain-containing protein [Croceicoccus sp. BE223]MDR7101763.1 PAS domain S-box-containing protein [Croceicoccus sp. BE223]